jgi:ATP phosphoribosyltransferase
MIKVALPNKGVLFEPTADILSACGYKVGKTLRSLSVTDAANGVEFYFLRPGDIPLYVANGTLDAGVTGLDFVAEKGVSPVKLLDLDFGHSKLCLAVPEGDKRAAAADLKGLRLATSFPRITAEKVPGVKVVELEGAVEISIKLGIADAIADIVETGTTLKQAGLKVIGDPLFRSNAALLAHPGRENEAEVLILKNRIQGKLVARANMMVEYDVPEAKLKDACALTPGIASPTVTPLMEKGWYSVKAVVWKREANAIMDKLAAMGCKGILLTNIESARI